MIALALLILSAAAAPMDMLELDAAIERCDRNAVLPVFANEKQRRSAFSTIAYQEQAAISAERAALARHRMEQNGSTEAARTRLAGAGGDARDLNMAQLMLDDRQRALDDLRRLEMLRREAVELKRQHFLEHCSSTRKKSD